eukprot:scaffold234_cov67-Phaeocystis_antarctica.AAC.3
MHHAESNAPGMYGSPTEESGLGARCASTASGERRGNGRRLAHGRLYVERAARTLTAAAGAPPWIALVACSGPRRPALALPGSRRPWPSVSSACGTRVEHEHGKRSDQLLTRGIVLGQLPRGAPLGKTALIAPARAHRRPTIPTCCGLSHGRRPHRPPPLLPAPVATPAGGGRRRSWRQTLGTIRRDRGPPRPAAAGARGGAGAVGAWAAPGAASVFYLYPASRRSYFLTTHPKLT